LLSGMNARHLTGLFLCLCSTIAAGRSLAGEQIASAPIALPPMGWSSWNSFSNVVDSGIVMAQAKAMATNGMQKAGYQFVNIDEGWWLGDRDHDGNIVVDPKAWPALEPGERAGDMSNIVRFIHGLGLKAGIYTDAGADGCSMYPDLGPKYFHTGSEDHYNQDFLQFARWGFDYVKVDWCGGDKENLDPAVQYAEIARAISMAESITGHRLYFSICEWGKNSPWTWAPNVGGAEADIWRTSGDIVAPIVQGHEHADRKAGFAAMLANFDHGVHPAAQHTGFYNDPDMMVLGMPGLNDDQNRLHMSLWAMSGAPLLIGADLTALNAATLATITNPQVIAVDQDRLGLQAVRIASPAAGVEVWSKLLAFRGQRAVLLLNRTGEAADVAVQWKDIGLDDRREVRIEDLWTGREIAGSPAQYSVRLSGGDFALLLVSGTDAEMTIYSSIPAPSAGDGKGASLLTKNGSTTFRGVNSQTQIAPLEVTYSNPGTSPCVAVLRVNEQIATRILFPPTGEKRGQVWVQVVLDHPGNGNELTFSFESQQFKILSIAVR
jgi:alpha galactosidase A-like protein/alpha-galactosidase-like CBM13-containing protein/alpha galactosidase C-like protein